MTPFYCTESQDRIPLELFPQGKAVFCGGKPYLIEHAKRLNLKPDASPPKEYLDAITAALQASMSAKPGEKKALPVSEPVDPAMSKVQLGPKGGASSTVHGSMRAMKDPLTASTVTPGVFASPVKPVEVNVEKPSEKATPPVTPEKLPEPQPVATAPSAAEPKAAEKTEPAVAPPPPPTKKVAMAPVVNAAKAQATPAEAPPPKPAASTPKPAAGNPVAPVKPAEAVKPPAVPSAAPAAAAKPPVKKEPARVLAEATLGYGEPISADELMKLPIFEGIAASQIERLPGAVVKRNFKKGEIICYEGQYGSTAFYILEGTADVFLNTPISQVKSDKKEGNTGFLGIIRKFTTKLSGRKEKTDVDAPTRSFIPIDGPSDLPLDNPIAQMKPGDLFGEMSCMSFYPRSATVRAREDCVMLEMLRNVLQVLQKNKKFKEQMDNAYRTRALGQHLRSVPILKDYVDDAIIEQLRYRVDLLDFDPGETIVKQGDLSDAFYLIRVGSVKVSQKHPGGEIVLTYLGRGEFFGEIGLLKNTPRNATCTALDHVEVVKIKKADFDFILSTYDELREKLLVSADARLKVAHHVSEHAPAVPLDDFLGQGLMQAQSLLLLDLEKCTRCDECVRACADSHDGVTRLVREGLRFDKFLVPTSCRSCMDPVCMIGCPVGSIRRKDSMEIIIEDWCIGCELCAKQCPYGNISMHPFDVQVADPANPGAKKADVKDKAVTCDLCTDLKEPSCVYACPHDAAHRVNARTFFLSELADSKKE